MTINELYARLNELYPSSLSCAWDNDGRMVVPDGERAVKKVLCCLDVDTSVVKKAVLSGVDLIISHHPLIFHALKSVVSDDLVGRKIYALARGGISASAPRWRIERGSTA